MTALSEEEISILEMLGVTCSPSGIGGTTNKKARVQLRIFYNKLWSDGPWFVDGDIDYAKQNRDT